MHSIPIIKPIIEAAWENRALLKEDQTQDSIREVIQALDHGTLRVAEPAGAQWIVNEWVKKAILLYSQKNFC